MSTGLLPALPSLGSIESEVAQAGGNGSPWQLPPILDTSPGAPIPSQQDQTGMSSPGGSNPVIGSSGSWFSFGSRTAAFIVGILCIGIGLLMFKQTQTIIQTAGRVAAAA